MPHDHPAQLQVCHEPIYEMVTDDLEPHHGHYCNLRSEVWCEDCGMLLCGLHANARHVTHTTHEEPSLGD